MCPTLAVLSISFATVLVVGIGLLFALAMAPAMALSPNELTKTTQSFPSGLRVEIEHLKVAKFAPGSGTLVRLTPLYFNTSTNSMGVWSATDGTEQISTITINATGGTFTATVNGQATAAVAYNATAATLQTAIDNLDNVLPGDFVVTGGPGATAAFSITTSITGRQHATAFTLTTGAGSLTGGAGTAVVATPTAAIAAVGKSQLKALVWPDAIVLDASLEVQGIVLIEGKVDYRDIPLPAGELDANMAAAFRTQARNLGIHMQGLTQVR